MKRYTTSAQKTIQLPVADIIDKLENHLGKQNNLVCGNKRSQCSKSKMEDGSTVVMAGFTKQKTSLLQ